MGSTKLRDSFPASATGINTSEQVQESFFALAGDYMFQVMRMVVRTKIVYSLMLLQL
jgi:hypothetical protein